MKCDWQNSGTKQKKKKEKPEQTSQKRKQNMKVAKGNEQCRNRKKGYRDRYSKLERKELQNVRDKITDAKAGKGDPVLHSLKYKK